MLSILWGRPNIILATKMYGRFFPYTINPFGPLILQRAPLILATDALMVLRNCNAVHLGVAAKFTLELALGTNQV